MFERTPEERAEDEARASAIAAERATAGDDGPRRPGETTDVEGPKAGPGAGSYVVAILLPIVGVVLAIREFARNNSGPAVALLLTSAVAGVGFYAVLSNTGSNGKCLVTALGGQKLCGDDAQAWCDATDTLRAGEDSDSQAVCDEIRR